MPAQKKTRLMTNSQAIAEELSRKCPGKHQHQQLLGGRAAEAARYPKGLCEAICRGVREEKRWRDMGARWLIMVNATTKVE